MGRGQGAEWNRGSRERRLLIKGQGSVFVCPPQPARAWPQALSHGLPRVRPPKSPAGDRVWAKSRCRHGRGRGCPGRLPGGGETAKKREMEWLSRDQRVNAAGGRAEPLRCQFSPRMESPGGVRGGGCFLLRGLFWGLKQIKSAAAPRVPSSCAEQLSRGGRRGVEPRFLPPTDLSRRPGGMGCGEGGRGRKRALGASQKPGQTWVFPPPALGCLRAETDYSISL